MRRLCFLLLFLFSASLLYAQNIPGPEGRVNDFAGIISPEYKQKLTSLIEELERKTSSEIAVVTLDSISPYGEIEYARLLFDKWKPGKKGKDNGVLVLLAVKERRWRIETGYGVEGVLPDSVCGEIGRNYMVPYFKQGKYGEGLYQGALKISQAIAKDAKVNLNGLADFQELPNIPWDSVIPIAVFLFIILIKYLSFKQRGNRHYYSGWGYGGGGGGGFGGGSLGGGGFGGGGFGGGGGGGGGGGAGGGF